MQNGTFLQGITASFVPPLLAHVLQGNRHLCADHFSRTRLCVNLNRCCVGASVECVCVPHCMKIQHMYVHWCDCNTWSAVLLP